MSEQQPQITKRKPNILLRLLALLITAALVLGALVLVVYREHINLDTLKRWLTYRTLETSQTGQVAPFTHAGGDKLSMANLDRGVLISSVAGAHYYSFSGEIYDQEVLTMENPVLASTDKAGVVYDAGGQSLFVFRNNEKTFDLTLEGGGDLLSARVNDSGWLAVTAQQSGYKGAVTVYNAAGERVIQISLSSTFLIDAALSPDCKTVAVVTMDQEGGAFRSQVLFYPVDQTQPAATVSLGNCTVLDLDYESGVLWVLGEDRLITLSQDDPQPKSYLFGRSYLKGCSLGGDGFALLLLGRYRAGSATQAVTVGSDGGMLASLALSGQILAFDSAGSYCSLLTGSALSIYHTQLSRYATLDVTQGARYTALSRDGSALLADAQQAWLFIPS